MQEKLVTQASGDQIAAESLNNNETSSVISLDINDCTISFSASTKGTDDSIIAVKEILLSAYRTKHVRD